SNSSAWAARIPAAAPHFLQRRIAAGAARSLPDPSDWPDSGGTRSAPSCSARPTSATLLLTLGCKCAAPVRYQNAAHPAPRPGAGPTFNLPDLAAARSALQPRQHKTPRAPVGRFLLYPDDFPHIRMPRQFGRNFLFRKRKYLGEKNDGYRTAFFLLRRPLVAQ